MNKDKLLNFAIAFLITVLIFNFFSSKKETTIVSNTIIFKSASDNYTIPNIPNIEITNNLDKLISINTCKNLTIRKDGAKIENIEKSFPKFCTNLDVLVK